jgi:predicted ATPase
MGPAKKTAITRVVVERLFGLYDYEIPGERDVQDVTTILILYGDNGCGKTTLLRLIFHLLAWEHRAGHKSFVARTKFRRVTIDFTNQRRIIAFRKGESLAGSFTMCLEKKGETVAQTEFLADSRNGIPLDSPNEQENDLFLDRLRDMNLALYLLGDDRRVSISSPEGARRYLDRRRRADLASEEEAYRVVWAREQQDRDPEQIAVRLLEESMDRLRAWIRDHVMRGSTRGESDVHEIFTGIVENIASDAVRTQRKKATRREHLMERIRAIEDRNRPGFNGQKLLNAISTASVNRFKDIRPIIVPYLESLEAKLDALSDIQGTIHRLITTLNSFVTDKTASFSLGRGLRMESRNHEHLKPEMLSSGERHLLLLFCNAVTALDRQSIFIIDEPEISLNIKWQRSLLSSLQEFAHNTPLQFIFATHSLEILSQHMEKVVKLESRGK